MIKPRRNLLAARRKCMDFNTLFVSLNSTLVVANRSLVRLKVSLWWASSSKVSVAIVSDSRQITSDLLMRSLIPLRTFVLDIGSLCGALISSTLRFCLEDSPIGPYMVEYCFGILIKYILLWWRFIMTPLSFICCSFRVLFSSAPQVRFEATPELTRLFSEISNAA